MAQPVADITTGGPITAALQLLQTNVPCMIHLRYCIYTIVSVVLTADASLVPAKSYVDDVNMNNCPILVRSPLVQEQAIFGILHYPLKPFVQVLPCHCRARQNMPLVRADAVEL